MSNPPKRSVSAELGTALFVRAISVDDEEEANADKYEQEDWDEDYTYDYDGFDAIDDYAENYTMGQGLRVGGGGGGGRKSKKNNSNTVFSSKHIRQVEARTSAAKKSRNGDKPGPVSSTAKAKKKNKAQKLRKNKKR